MTAQSYSPSRKSVSHGKFSLMYVCNWLIYIAPLEDHIKKLRDKVVSYKQMHM